MQTVRSAGSLIESMPPISIKAILLAFGAEFIADQIIRSIAFAMFAQSMYTTGMPDAELEKVRQAVFDTTSYIPWMFAFGGATTVAGGYLAARIAKKIPYYHGLGIGVVGVLFILTFWQDEAGWLDWLGLLITIPLSVYGAHLAKLHMTPNEPPEQKEP
jgi:hypothetical protein